MSPCTCGREVRMRALKTRVMGYSGITHWLEHTDGSMWCHEKFEAYMEKPYPKEGERPYIAMIAKWEALVNGTGSSSAVRDVPDQHDAPGQEP